MVLVWCVLVLLAWSYLSEQQPGSDLNRRYSWLLLCAADLLARLGLPGRPLQAYALATLAGLKRREQPVSAFWLGLLFALSLSVERVLYRLLGLGIQVLS